MDINEQQQVLKDLFGFHSFLPNQENIVRAILQKQDTFVVMPTGGGKSLCYQLPAHIMHGTCIVISPLISLMKDQVDAAVETGLKASFLNSSLSLPMKREVESQLAAGQLDMIYVSPERFAMPEFIEVLKTIDLAFVAIDEAHCISEWGHDFRPDYLNLSTIVEHFPDIPIAAFTATATHRVQKDIVTKLQLRSPHIVRASFNRPNLLYKVHPKHNPAQQILKFVRLHEGEAGIVYRTTRKSVDETAAMLERHGIKALPYHAGLPDTTREKNQNDFNRDHVDVIVATIAFGMGIDKSNVRYVLHGDLPKNMEGYYQETGRAGRDGEPAQCLLLFGHGDIPKIRFFINQIENETEQQHAIRCLNDMINYATVHACRRKQLLNYFGEDYPSQPVSDSPPCCDLCSGEVESIDGTIDAQIIMSAMIRTGERFGTNYIISVVVGDHSDRIQQLGHDQIKTFGAGKDKTKKHWRLVISNLLAQGFILQTTGDYPILQLRPEAREVLFKGRKVQILKTTRKPKKKKSREGITGPYNEQLFMELCAIRKELAKEQGVPPYIIFTDRTLHEMARFFPSTDEEMLQLTGVGQKKSERYGTIFLKTIATFRESHPDIQGKGTLPDLTDQTRTATSSYLEEARREHVRAYEKWSDEEDDRLRQAWIQQSLSSDTRSASKRIAELSDNFGRNPGAIRSRLKKLNLVSTSADRSSEE